MIRRMFGSTVKKDSGLNILDYNPNVWLDAQDASTVTLVGGKVSQWANKANSNHATQTTPSMRPLYVVSAVSNGFPSIEIPNVGDYGFFISNFTEIKEIIIVTSFKTGIESQFTDFSTLIGPSGPERILGNSGDNNLLLSNALTDQVFKNNSSSSTDKILPLPFTVCNFRFTGLFRTNISFLFNGTTRSWAGFTGEAIFFATQLPPQDRTDIINHLMKKWGI